MNAAEAAARYGHRTSICGNASIALRARVRLSRARLDRRLAGCEELGDASDALALRARQLTSREQRCELAASLRASVEYADRERSRLTAVMLDRSAVRQAREPILGLAERLEGPDPVNPRGVALANLLLTEGVSPLYSTAERSVTEAIWEIQDRLGSFYVERATAPRR